MKPRSTSTRRQWYGEGVEQLMIPSIHIICKARRRQCDGCRGTGTLVFIDDTGQKQPNEVRGVQRHQIQVNVQWWHKEPKKNQNDDSVPSAVNLIHATWILSHLHPIRDPHPSLHLLPLYSHQQPVLLPVIFGVHLDTQRRWTYRANCCSYHSNCTLELRSFKCSLFSGIQWLQSCADWKESYSCHVPIKRRLLIFCHVSELGAETG